MSGLKVGSGRKTLVAALASLGLVAALALPALAGEEDPDWATVTGYAEGTAENNHADTWGENCEDVATPQGGWGMTYVLPDLAEGMLYSLVIVKAGSDVSTDGHANTLFEDPLAGQTVWADSNGSAAFDEGDKTISHIIVCTEEAEDEEETPTPTPTPTPEATPTPTPTPTPASGQLGGNPTPTPGTLPDTAAGAFTSIPATLLAVAMLAALGTLTFVRVTRQR